DGTYERTPRGERVLRETEAIMRRLNALVNDQEFIPAQRFRIAMTDHGSTILLPNVLERLRRDAPDSELVLSAAGPHSYEEVVLEFPSIFRPFSRSHRRTWCSPSRAPWRMSPSRYRLYGRSNLL